MNHPIASQLASKFIVHRGSVENQVRAAEDKASEGEGENKLKGVCITIINGQLQHHCSFGELENRASSLEPWALLTSTDAAVYRCSILVVAEAEPCICSACKET